MIFKKLPQIGFAARVTILLVCFSTASILVVAGLGYTKLYGVTEEHAAIRIDRASRAAASILSHSLTGEFNVKRDESGKPLAIRINGDSPEQALTFKPLHDEILREIGLANQGAANLFVFNSSTKGFDRFATTFRKPDGTMPPPMSLSKGHPAWDNLFANRPHIGEVPVMGRMRLAYLTPIQALDGSIAGALAVDVGWVDDLWIARNELRTQFITWAFAIVLFASLIGVFCMSSELRPLRVLAQFADKVASGEHVKVIPYSERADEVGALSMGLSRVAELQSKLSVLAYTDETTGIGNRSRYLADLKIRVKDSLSGVKNSVLLHVDLDKFKETNDAFGQSAGDALLKIISEMLVDLAGDNASVARLTGDQYTILTDCDGKGETILKLCQSIISTIAQPISLPQGEVQIGASIGVVTLPLDAKSVDEAHLNADLALRQAKISGGGCHVFYNNSMNADLQKQIQMERMLREAIEAKDFMVFFQPQINPSDCSLTGVEALARWKHVELGFIGPDKFIPVAETTGLIVDLGLIILDKACQQVRTWLDEDFEFKHVSINVSPIQLWQSDFLQKIDEALEKHNISGEHICLEVTEGIFLERSEGRIRKIFEALQKQKIQISLDDFGSGYSSLGYLNRMPFSQLKIDRSFVSNIDKDPSKYSLLVGIAALGRGLEMDIVFEGAETEGEVLAIQSMGGKSIQGYYYAKPDIASKLPSVILDIAA